MLAEVYADEEGLDVDDKQERETGRANNEEDAVATKLWAVADEALDGGPDSPGQIDLFEFTDLETAASKVVAIPTASLVPVIGEVCCCCRCCRRCCRHHQCCRCSGYIG